MASLQRVGDGSPPFFLLAETSIGRTSGNTMVLADPRISSHHAVLRQRGAGGWTIRDLGSKNGTRVDNRPLRPAEDVRLEDGQTIELGDHQQRYVFHQGTPASLLVVPERPWDQPGSRCHATIQRVLGVPSDDHPRAQLSLADDEWCIEWASGEIENARHLGRFEVDQQTYVVHSPLVAPTPTASAERLRLASVRLELRVSANEEHVDATVQVASRCFPLSSRVYLYLLVLLGRARIEDVRAGASTQESGWRPRDWLVNQLSLSSPEALNVQVFRLRRDFAMLDLEDAASIIERRKTSAQARIGIEPSNLVVKRHR